jgi:hypothetical protein
VPSQVALTLGRRPARDMLPDGTSRRRGRWAHEILDDEIRERAIQAANSPEANAKKSAARMGKPMHPRTRQALANSRLRRLSAEQRRRIGDAHQRLPLRRAARTYSEGRMPGARAVPELFGFLYL